MKEKYNSNKAQCKSVPNNCLIHELQSIPCMNSVVDFHCCWILRVRLKRGTGIIVTEEFMRGLRHEKFLTFHGTEGLWVLTMLTRACHFNLIFSHLNPVYTLPYFFIYGAFWLLHTCPFISFFVASAFLWKSWHTIQKGVVWLRGLWRNMCQKLTLLSQIQCWVLGI
jgi:hypothetical protein